MVANLHNNRFARYFCDKINGEYVCYEPDNGLYISDDNKVLYSEKLDNMDNYFQCGFEYTTKKKFPPCLWNHEDTKTFEINAKKLENIKLPEYKKVNVKNKRKPVPVLKFGASIVDKNEFEKALRVFLGDPVKVYYSTRSPISPIVIEDENTGEVIMLSPYW